MSGFIAGAAVTAGASMYASGQANKAADQRARDANLANTAAANRSRELSEASAAKRKAELLRRFDIKADKTVDTNRQINTALSTKLTNFSMELSASISKTENALATRNIRGRLADRMRTAAAVQSEMKKGTLIQAAEASHEKIGDNLEMMRMNYESEYLNVGIDLADSINAANNQEVRGWTASTSTGGAGVMASGIGGASQGLSLGLNIKAAL